jgi:hypothetical protein
MAHPRAAMSYPRPHRAAPGKLPPRLGETSQLPPPLAGRAGEGAASEASPLRTMHLRDKTQEESMDNSAFDQGHKKHDGSVSGPDGSVSWSPEQEGA